MAATLTSSSSSTATLLSPRPRHIIRLPLSPSLPPASPMPLDLRARSLSPAALDGSATSMRKSEEDFRGSDSGEEEGEGDRRSLRPRRTHLAATPSPTRRTLSLSPAPSSPPAAHVPQHKTARHKPATRLRLPALLKHRLAPPALDVYDTLIALAFAACVVLFFRALSGAGDVAGRQAHHAYAPTRAALHARAGTFCSVPLGSPASAPGESTPTPALHRHRPHHHTGVPPDPHAHASVDPEGSWSYALDHHLPHLHLPAHASAHEHDDQHAWKALRERMWGLMGVVTGQAEMVDEDGDGQTDRQGEKDEVDVVYPMRVHLPPSVEDLDVKGALQKHRKARGRSRI